METRPTHSRSPAAVVLFLLCVGLGAGLYYQHQKATQETKDYLGTINQLSNRWHEACLKLNEQKLVNLSLERDFSVNPDRGEPAKAPPTLPADGLQPKAATHVAVSGQPDPCLTELQDERDALASNLKDLTSAMAKLDCEMAETRQRLQASDGDRTALLRELKRLQADRDKLLTQFNSLALVREQLHKLKAEQAVSRRLEWIRHGTYGNYKGAELLRKSLASAAPVTGNYDLNVELHRTANPAVPPTGH